MHKKRETLVPQVERAASSRATAPNRHERETQAKRTVHEPKLLLKPSDVARMISCSRSKVYELIESGALPAVRLEGGRLLRVPLAAVDQIVADAMHVNPVEQSD